MASSVNAPINCMRCCPARLQPAMNTGHLIGNEEGTVLPNRLHWPGLDTFGQGGSFPGLEKERCVSRQRRNDFGRAEGVIGENFENRTVEENPQVEVTIVCVEGKRKSGIVTF